MRLLLTLLFCLHFILACSSRETDIGSSTETLPEHLQDVENLTVLPVDSEPLFEIDLVEERNFGDKYDDVVYLGFVNDFAVDDSGRVYLADMTNAKIHVYNPDGSFLQSIGRSGRGPGEFLTTYGGGLDIGVNDQFLFVYDSNNYRVSRFSLDTFDLVDIVNLDQNNWSQLEEISGSRPFRFILRDDGRYLVHFRVSDYPSASMQRVSTHKFYLFNDEMEPVSDKIYEYKRPESVRLNMNGGQPFSFRSFPFTNPYLTAISGSGHIYESSSEEFLISMYESDGTYTRSVYAPLEAARFTEDDQEKLVEANPILGRGFSAIDMPEHWPLLNRILVDDENRLWVSIIRDSHDFTEWWVLDENFNILAKFPWPRKITDRPGDTIDHKFIIKNKAMYYLGTDAMNLDQQTVIKYRIEMNPINSELSEQ